MKAMMSSNNANSGRGAERPVVALVQMSGAPAKQRNVEMALARISEAASAGANIVCLQELFAGQYPCQTEDHRRFDEGEPIPGQTSQTMAGAARRDRVV